MLTVACVYRSGGEYCPDDVVRLARGVHSHLTIPFRMVCLTDRSDEVSRHSAWYSDMTCQIHRLLANWRGWWSKMEVFGLAGPVLYLDLDTVIVGSLDELAYRVLESDKLLMLRGFYRGDRCSGIMGWGAGVSTQWILDSFIADLRNPPAYVQTETALRMTMKTRTCRGDQEWLDHLLNTTLTPTVFVQDVASGIYSYKVNVKGVGLPNDARVVCFHGKPRPSEVDEPWMQRHRETEVAGAAI